MTWWQITLLVMTLPLIYVGTADAREHVQRVPVGQTAGLFCPNPHDRNRKVPRNWFKVHEELPSKSIIGFETLTIPEAQKEDSGVYECWATRLRRTFLVKTIRLIVEDEVTVEHVQRVQVGEKAALYCHNPLLPAPGGKRILVHPPPRDWTKVDGELPSNSIIGFDTLTIPEAQTEDSGVYKCLENNRGRISLVQTFRLIVEDKLDTIVFQRRTKGDVDFDRDWDDYKYGFGNIDTGDFWLGNEVLHQLTTARKYELLVQFTFNSKTYSAAYSNFAVLGEADNYRLEVGGYSGNAGDSLAIHHNGAGFSTKNKDNDNSEINCAQIGSGGWWYYNCHFSNLNGRWGSKVFDKGINWYNQTGFYDSATATEMKIRLVGWIHCPTEF